MMSIEKVKKNLFVTHEDLLTLPSLQNSTVIVIQSPRASIVEVLNPDMERRFIVRSPTGPISLYLLSKDQETNTRHSEKHHHPLTPTSTSSSTERALDATTNTSSGSRIGKVQKIVVSHGGIEEDYWLKSDVDVSLSDLWSSETL